MRGSPRTRFFLILGFAAISVFAYAQLSTSEPQGGRYNATSGNTQGVQQLVSLTAGTTQDFPFQVGGGTALRAELGYQGTGTLTLITPGGQEITEANASQYNTVVERGDVTAEAVNLAVVGPHVAFTVSAPAAGVWIARVRASSALNGLLVAATNGQGALQASSTLNSLTRRYGLGDWATLTAGIVILQAGETTTPAQLKGLTVTATVTTSPPTTTTTLTLRDDGQSPDNQVNDGDYSAVLPTNTDGTYRVVLVYKDSAGKVVGTNNESYTVSGQQGRINSIQDVGPTDVNGDGLTDYFTLNVNVTSTQTGRHDAVVYLRATNGKEYQVSGSAQLSAGGGVIPVQVSADDVRQALGVDGPYSMRLVAASYIPDVPSLPSQSLGTLESGAQTQAYQLTALQRAPITILGLGTDQGVDTNADGFFDTLNVPLNLNVLQAGSYAWSATLKDAQGNLIDTAQASGDLITGNNVLPFNFNGEVIGLTGMNGPYTIDSITVYPQYGGDGLLSDAAFPTQTYRSSQFNGGVIRGKFSGVLKGNVVIKSGTSAPIQIPLKLATIVLDLSEQNGVLTGTATVGDDLMKVVGTRTYSFSGTRSGSTIFFTLPYRNGGTFKIQGYLAVGKNIEIPGATQTITSGSNSATLTYSSQVFTPTP